MMKPTLLRMREGKEGGGKGPLLSEDMSLTLTGTQDVLFSPTPPSSAASEDSTLGLNVPAGAPSASARSTPTPAPSSASDGPVSPTSVTSSTWAFDPTAGLGMRAYDDGTTPGLKVGTGLGMGWSPGIAQPSGQAASLARTSPSRASDEGSPVPAAASPSPSLTLWDGIDLPSASWRTYLASSPVMEGETWRHSSVRWQTSGMAWRTGCSTLVTSECPSAADGSSSSPCAAVTTTLTDVLLPSAPPRYSLSARAAQGILRRASKRGRTLPPELETALTSLAQSPAPATSATTTTPTPCSPSDSPTPSAPAQATTATPVHGETAPTPSSWTVRRLTPTECERLMGWDDGWTIVSDWSTRPRQSGADQTTTTYRRGTSSSEEPPA